MDANRIIFYEFGNPLSVLKIEKKMVERPLIGEILVRMKFRPINPSDLIPIRGAYSHRISLPTIPGYEGVGIVEDVGPHVSKQLIGKRVLPLRGEGTWQDYVKTSANFAVCVPTYIDDVTASQLYINPLTAWLTCTEVLQLKADDFLLINACGSAIGRIYAQLAKVIGYQLIAVTRNDFYTNDLLDLGASYVINTTTTCLQSSVKEITNGYGVDYAIDSVGGLQGAQLADCVKPNGTILTIGLLSGKPVHWTEVCKKAKINVKLFHLRHWNKIASDQTWNETFQHIFSLISGKKLSLQMPRSYYELPEVKEAIIDSESPKIKNNGKVILTS